MPSQDGITVALPSFYGVSAVIQGILVENCELAVIWTSQFNVDVVSCTM